MALPLKPEQVREVRDQIRHIAEQHMAKLGSTDISLRAVAAEMGWTAASLYRYFDSKIALIAATRTAAYDRFSTRIEHAYNSTDDLWARSRAIGEAYIAFAFDEPAAYKLIFAYEQPEAEKTDELVAAEQRSRRTLTGYVADMVAAGLIEGEPEILAHAYWASLHGLISLHMAGKLSRSVTFDTVKLASRRLITRGALPLQDIPRDGA
ncbi:putative TetR family transcriptional regulator [Caenibius tardaugens NBRC 16725]|uniref:Putative TetR family transcriptional regulator n=1 Tax=Caenibius tardaugens NBRC 16725 TaxID=1219035 RepID=U2YQX0_9SPHN|nr:TetR/AcrR family transcriptional regulator [Caenibius tardaugens]AZI35512.1 TetR/AcrR family transcriptional regulator [Caenibius tardaugens NBRC 16725]GAD51117.1 putative TetR family transcriptional regulator [Caenibius tardaugens NBRC 16725]